MRDENSNSEARSASAALLDWYNANAREMPWRVGPSARASGVRPDPYRVWMSEIMLQQTTVAAVREKFLLFMSCWPDVAALARAEDAEVMAAWAGLGYYARARNLLKCARVVTTDFGGVFPDDHAALLKLPGIGPYTAAAISAIAFDRPETVVDGNVERVVARLFAVETPLPAAKRELNERAARLTPEQRPGDHAQAMMDLGATICTPTSPRCGVCPIIRCCAAQAAGIASSLPRKLRKAPKPVRRGIAYVVRRSDGALLLETRPPNGLLGGMLGWPGSEWGEAEVAAPPLETDWTRVPAEVRHTFTHFHLVLSVDVGAADISARPLKGNFVPAADFAPESLPTVMRKVWNVASNASLPL